MRPVTPQGIGESRAHLGKRKTFLASTDYCAITPLHPCCLRYAIDGLFIVPLQSPQELVAPSSLLVAAF